MAFDYDAIICGAGAAGLMAGIHAAERGRRVLLLEKNKRAGIKILASGGTTLGIPQKEIARCLKLSSSVVSYWCRRTLDQCLCYFFSVRVSIAEL